MQSKLPIAVLCGVLLMTLAACGGGGDGARITELEADLVAEQEARELAEEQAADAELKRQAEETARLEAEAEAQQAEREAAEAAADRGGKGGRRRSRAAAAGSGGSASGRRSGAPRLAAAAEERRQADAAERARTAIAGHDAEPLPAPSHHRSHNQIRRARARHQSGRTVHDIDGQIGQLVDDLAHRQPRAERDMVQIYSDIEADPSSSRAVRSTTATVVLRAHLQSSTADVVGWVGEDHERLTTITITADRHFVRILSHHGWEPRASSLSQVPIRLVVDRTDGDPRTERATATKRTGGFILDVRHHPAAITPIHREGGFPRRERFP